MNTTPPINDGGAAFPCPMSQQSHSNQDCGPFQGGMALRDYFAAKFMARAQSLSETSDGGWDFDNAAQCCYAMADAMLKARAE